MKKNLFLVLLTAVLVSCSSDGSRKIQIDNVEFTPANPNTTKEQEISKQASVFEVVPGSYSLSWSLVHDLPQQQMYNVELKLKLRLKKKVNILPSVYEELNEDNPYYTNFNFELVDANGESNIAAVQDLNISNNRLEDWATKGLGNKDKIMEFYDFLSSEPGTEVEIVLNSLGVKSNVNCIDFLKNAKGVRCLINGEDKYFEKRFGTIVE